MRWRKVSVWQRRVCYQDLIGNVYNLKTIDCGTQLSEAYRKLLNLMRIDRFTKSDLKAPICFLHFRGRKIVLDFICFTIIKKPDVSY
jgi:hypothetical protein